jgi:HlyD family secretion protein
MTKTNDTKNIRSEWSVADGASKVATSGPHDLAAIPANFNAPAPRSNHKLISVRLHWPRVALALAIIVGCSLAGLYWWRETHPQLPLSIVFGNGRLESDEIDIDTKFAARIAEIFVDEGAMVKAGQIVARMDTRDLEASLKKSQAQVNQAQRAIDEADHNVIQLTTQTLLAQQELDRAKYLVERGAETKQVLDQRQQQLDGANAALSAGKDRVTEAQHALEA